MASKRFKQDGFIITLEFILISTILLIGIVVGVVAVRDALIKYKFRQDSNSIIVYDSDNRVLGKAIGFDEHEAPLLYYIDRSQTDANGDLVAYRALIGVRDDRFTSREPIYYTQPNCQGDPCIKKPSAELMDNQGIDFLPGTGAVSYLYAMQGGPTYAVGRSPNGIPGFLYTQSTEACPISATDVAFGSRYNSQKVEYGEPCETPFVLPISGSQPPVNCPTNLNKNLCERTGCLVEGKKSCGCPIGYSRSPVDIDNSDLADFCCPDGTNLEMGGALGLEPLCKGSGLVKAIPVASASNPAQNALEAFTPPFNVSLPQVEIGDDAWRHIPPEGE